MNASAAENAETPPPQTGPGIMTRVKAVVFVAVIVAIEVAAAAMLFPSADDTRAVGEQLAHGAAGEHAESDQKDEQGHAGGEEAHGEKSHEASLGAYHIISFNPETKKSMSVDFELFGVVLAEEEPEFNELYTVHEKRINEQVTIAVRGMLVKDFTDPGLGLMKRIILEKTNRALGKPLIREVTVPQFSFLER